MLRQSRLPHRLKPPIQISLPLRTLIRIIDLRKPPKAKQRIGSLILQMSPSTAHTFPTRVRKRICPCLHYGVKKRGCPKRSPPDGVAGSIPSPGPFSYESHFLKDSALFSVQRIASRFSSYESRLMDSPLTDSPLTDSPLMDPPLMNCLRLQTEVGR